MHMSGGEPMALRQPELRDWEHPQAASHRTEMKSLGWTQNPAPVLNERIPESLVPAESWTLLRRDGSFDRCYRALSSRLCKS